MAWDCRVPGQDSPVKTVEGRRQAGLQGLAATPREVIAILTAPGFEQVRQCGSHKRFRHADGRATTVPVHAGWHLSPILLRCIARDVGLTVHEFVGR